MPAQKCERCNKTYIRQDYFNNHLIKCQPPVQAEIVTPFEDCISEVSMPELPLDYSEDFECLNEPLSEDDVFTMQYDSEVISTNQCVSETHCSTCSCFKETIQIDSVTTIRSKMAMPDYLVAYELPIQAIRDVRLVGDKILETDIQGDKLYRSVPFKHYLSDEITSRITTKKFEFQSKELADYKKSDNQPHTYLNFKNGLTDYEVIMKYSVENDIKYSADGFNPTLIAFDVEAYNPDPSKKDVPSHKNGGVISMICAVFSKPNDIERFVVYILNQYAYNKTKISQFIQARRSDLKHKNPDIFKIDVIECENQTIMACAFLDDVKACGLSLLYGFNSSATCQVDKLNEHGKIIEKVSVGYDLPFIVHNSARYTQQEVEHGAKLFGKIGKQIKRLSWLPETYILDCMVIFQNDRYFAMKLSDMPDRKLNSFLEQAKIPLKEDDMDIYARMDQMRIKGSDQTDCVNYCIWDSYALTQVMKRIKFVESVVANVEIFNIPLSWALHKNATNWCTMLMLRRYYKNGYGFSYAKFPMPKPKDKQTFRGATTESCPSDQIMQVLDNIAMWDFQSLYPNAIISANLGIDSLRPADDGNCYAVDLNFVDKYLVESAKNKLALQESTDVQKLSKEELKVFKKNKVTDSELSLLEADKTPIMAYFSKVPSLYATIIDEILQKRLDIKEQMKDVDVVTYEQLDARQNALKIFVNTIYGLSGAETFQLYDIKVASACTSVSRKLTYLARQAIEELQIGRVAFRDTDSCAVMVSDDIIKKIYDHSAKLNALVNQKFKADLGNTHIVKFILEDANFQEKTYFPPAKKAYARIECHVKDIIYNKPITRELKIKGVSWSLMSTHGKEFFRQHTEYILSNLHVYPDIQDYVNVQLNSVRNDIKTLVETKNYSEMARKYHKQLKNSQNNKTAKYLRQTFNVTEHEIHILPIVKASKLKSHCVVPVKYAHQFQIDENQLLDWFISPFVKFYGKFEYAPEEYDQFDNIIECRLASQIGYHSRTKMINIEYLPEKLENTSISYNEVIKTVNKLFFDIDDAFNELNFHKCLAEIGKMICKFRHNNLGVEFAYTKSTSTKKPYSYHVVYQIKSSRAMNKYIAEQVNQIMKFKIIDTDVYGINKSLRLPNSPKWNKDTKEIEQVYHRVVCGTFDQMILTDLDNITNSLSNAIGFIENGHNELGYQNVEVDDKYLEAIKSYIPFPVVFQDQVEGTIDIEPVNYPYICPVCTRKHDSVQMVAYLRKDGFVLNCWSKANEDKKTIKHKFDAVAKSSSKTAKVNKLIRINQLKQYAETTTDYKFRRINPQNIEFQHNEQVAYDLSSQTTFVRSQMMTGKTKQQIKLTATDEYPTVLALSFRRTFARDNAEKNDFVNYESIEGELNLIDYPKLILQVDSLARLNLAVMPSLLIIDEIESTIEQLLSIKRDTSPYILFKFIELLQHSNKILCLDAELEQSTIEAFTQLIGTDNYKVFVNTFKPKTDSKIFVHDYVSNQAKDIAHITNQIKAEVENGKKVVVFSTSRARAEEFKVQMPTDKIVKYYDGEDAKKHNGKSMAKIKAEDFQDVNKAWADCDILIYTGTLTAGVSFELERFDTFIGLFAKRSGSALGFTQGLHRVRNFADKVGHIYLEKEGSYLPDTAYKITENQTKIYGHTDLSEVNQFKNWITASTNQSSNRRLQVVIRNLQNMGYQLEIMDTVFEGVRSEVAKQLQESEIKDIATAQITLEDLTRIPKVMKSTILIIKDEDPLLHAKYQKVKIFKSFYPVHDEQSIANVNALNAEQINVLYQERPRIAEGNKIKNIVKKCLNERPEFTELKIDQMAQIVEACRLESQQNIKAQYAGTVQKDSILKFHEQIYIVTQALKVRDLMVDLEQNTLEKALNHVAQLETEGDLDEKTKKPKMVINPVAQTLKNIGFGFGKNGIHHKLNEILKHIDLQLDIVKNDKSKPKQITIAGKRVVNNKYTLKTISAESILKGLATSQQPESEPESQ